MEASDGLCLGRLIVEDRNLKKGDRDDMKIQVGTQTAHADAWTIYEINEEEA